MLSRRADGLSSGGRGSASAANLLSSSIHAHGFAAAELVDAAGRMLEATSTSTSGASPSSLFVLAAWPLAHALYTSAGRLPHPLLVEPAAEAHAETRASLSQRRTRRAERQRMVLHLAAAHTGRSLVSDDAAIEDDLLEDAETSLQAATITDALRPTSARSQFSLGPVDAVVLSAGPSSEDERETSQSQALVGAAAGTVRTQTPQPSYVQSSAGQPAAAAPTGAAVNALVAATGSANAFNMNAGAALPGSGMLGGPLTVVIPARAAAGPSLENMASPLARAVEAAATRTAPAGATAGAGSGVGIVAPYAGDPLRSAPAAAGRGTVLLTPHDFGLSASTATAAEGRNRRSAGLFVPTGTEATSGIAAGARLSDAASRARPVRIESFSTEPPPLDFMSAALAAAAAASAGDAATAEPPTAAAALGRSSSSAALASHSSALQLRSRMRFGLGGSSGGGSIGSVGPAASPPQVASAAAASSSSQPPARTPGPSPLLSVASMSSAAVLLAASPGRPRALPSPALAPGVAPASHGGVGGGRGAGVAKGSQASPQLIVTSPLISAPAEPSPPFNSHQLSPGSSSGTAGRHLRSAGVAVRGSALGSPPRNNTASATLPRLTSSSSAAVLGMAITTAAASMTSAGRDLMRVGDTSVPHSATPMLPSPLASKGSLDGAQTTMVKAGRAGSRAAAAAALAASTRNIVAAAPMHLREAACAVFLCGTSLAGGSDAAPGPRHEAAVAVARLAACPVHESALVAVAALFLLDDAAGGSALSTALGAPPAAPRRLSVDGGPQARSEDGAAGAAAAASARGGDASSAQQQATQASDAAAARSLKGQRLRSGLISRIFGSGGVNQAPGPGGGMLRRAPSSGALLTTAASAAAAPHDATAWSQQQQQSAARGAAALGLPVDLIAMEALPTAAFYAASAHRALRDASRATEGSEHAPSHHAGSAVPATIEGTWLLANPRGGTDALLQVRVTERRVRALCMCHSRLAH